MIPKCPECERRGRDERFDNMTFANAIVTAIGCGLVGSLISQDVAVWCVVLGGVVGWIAGWRLFARHEAEHDRRKP